MGRENFLCLHGLLPEMVTGQVSPGTILNPLRRMDRPASFHLGEVESIDLDARRVVTTRPLDGARAELEYDQLVLAVGCDERLDAYPGLAEHAFKLSHFADAFRLRNHILEMFELAEGEEDPDERRALLTFLVAGGGFSGTELACELADFATRLTAREFSGIRREECRIAIVHPGPTLLPELYGSGNLERRVKAFPKLVEYGTRHATRVGVDLMLNTQVVGATPTEIYLSNGEHIQTRTIVSTVGTKANQLLESLSLERDERGRVAVDEYLRVVGREDLWAGGDCAAVPHPKGGTCPPTALYALTHGRRIGSNIARAVSGRSLRPYKMDIKLQGVSIGGRRAVVELFGMGMHGFLPWLIWRAGVTVVMPSWDRRLRTVADWVLSPLVGRDIVDMGSFADSGYEVLQNFYEPDELIGDRASLGRYVHVVVEGEVELLVRTDGDDEAVVTLGQGGHFGRRRLELVPADLARAKSAVRTVALRADQASRLQDTFAAAEKLDDDAISS